MKAGHHILIVEDDALQAMDLEFALQDAGFPTTLSLTIISGMKRVPMLLSVCVAKKCRSSTSQVKRNSCGQTNLLPEQRCSRNHIFSLN